MGGGSDGAYACLLGKHHYRGCLWLQMAGGYTARAVGSGRSSDRRGCLCSVYALTGKSRTEALFAGGCLGIYRNRGLSSIVISEYISVFDRPDGDSGDCTVLHARLVIS